MTGKFKDCNNAFGIIVSTVTMCVILCVGFCISDTEGEFALTTFLGFAALFLCIPLGHCSFIAYKNKVVFRVGFINHKYSYSEIKSAEVQTGFTHSRYGSSPHVKLVIFLTNGESVTFRDNTVPDDALSTPEKHKEFHENHQFTKLSDYINQRAGNFGSNASNV